VVVGHETDESGVESIGSETCRHDPSVYRDAMTESLGMP
jgi:hypothetical protein